MTIALLQPTFGPDLYDLACMLQADTVFLQDNEPWSRKGRVHRARIRTPNSTQWVNIPVLTEDRSKPLCNVRIDHSADWQSPILKALRFNYRNSIYFDHYEPEIRADFHQAKQYTFLLSFVLYFRQRLFDFLQVEMDTAQRTSGLDAYDPDPDLFVENMGADAIFQEYKSRHYMRQAQRYHAEPRFKHPTYRQHFKGFKPHCSLLDLLFQYGPESFKIIDQLTTTAVSSR